MCWQYYTILKNCIKSSRRASTKWLPYHETELFSRRSRKFVVKAAYLLIAITSTNLRGLLFIDWSRLICFRPEDTNFKQNEPWLRNLGAQSIFRQRITINSCNYLENIYKGDLTHEFHCQVHKVKDCHKIALKIDWKENKCVYFYRWDLPKELLTRFL